MPRLSRTPLLLLLALLLAGVITLLLWTSHRPPAITRLLPEADGIVYANLKPLRLATHFDRSAPPRSPEFQSFVDATGIVPERDLDEAAFALERRSNPDGPNGPVAFSEIFAGRFDRPRLEHYLAGLARSEEHYAGHTIYALPSGEPASPEPRLLRITMLRAGLIAASNTPTAEGVHAMIDHARAGLFASTAPSLLTDRFRDVPTLAGAWAIGRVGLPFAEANHIALFGLELPLAADQPMVASLRYLGVLRLRVEILTPTPEAAMQQTGALTGLLGLVRSLTAGAAAASPPEMKAALSSVSITQTGSRTLVTADLPTSLIRSLLGGGGAETTR